MSGSAFAPKGSIVQWKTLDNALNTQMWEIVKNDLMFDPSVHPQDRPGSRPNLPGTTFNVALDATSADEFIARSGKINQSLWDLVHDEMQRQRNLTYFLLEWQHVGFEGSSSDAIELGRLGPIKLFPDGDYPIFMAADRTFYLVGDPWAKTISLFGESIPDALMEYLSGSFPIVT